MKDLNYLNYFAVGLPLGILITYPIYNEGALLFSLLSTILTGLIQVIIGIKMLIKEPNNIHLKAYIFFVISFFFLWYINSTIGYINILTNTLIAIPAILAIYLTVIIYKKAQNENAN